ncbi:MAG: CehA/McbA family metallohydrolase [Alphaproteobacteria bacterium]|nr:CehA/McbA family metallohydrolase [Alphaproteobacteria bacterium]
MILVALALAQETVLTLDGAVTDDGTPFERVTFEVPAGTAEIEVRHASLNSANFFDWGVDDPSGFRGWGGGNSEPAVIGANAASRSYLPGPMTPGTWSVSIGKPVMDAAPFDYALEVVLRTEPTLTPRDRVPYAPAAPLETGRRWYAGDFHVHSLESGDASAEIDAIAAFAAGRGLDFVVISDHNTSSTLDFLVDAQARHPDVLLIPGQEFTTYRGHAGAIGVTGPLPYQLGLDGNTIQTAIDAVHGGGGLFAINHPNLDLGNLCRGCAWEHDVDFAEVDAIELMTGGFEPVGGLFLDANLALWEQMVAAGHHVAAIGGSDDHRAGTDTGPTASSIGSPTTMVEADELSVAAILAGVAAGRTVVKLQEPGDPMVAIEGGADTQTGAMPLVAVVTGGDGAQVRFVVDGVPQPTATVVGESFEHVLETPLDQEVRVRAELMVGGDPRVITSHVWYTQTAPAPPDDGKCGCDAGGVAWLGPILPLVLRKRR